MTDPTLPAGPDPEAIIAYLTTTYPATDAVTMPGAWFFSLDPEKHWPNYATIVTNDEHDQASDLERPGVFRLNLSVDKATFQRYVGHAPRNLKAEFPYPKMVPASIERAISLAEGNHPAILSARAAIRASQAGSDAAKAAFGPTLNLIGSVCALCFSQSSASPNGNLSASGQVQLSLTIPIYAGGALGAALHGPALVEPLRQHQDRSGDSPVGVRQPQRQAQRARDDGGRGHSNDDQQRPRARLHRVTHHFEATRST